jgi:hypothetical protein
LLLTPALASPTTSKLKPGCNTQHRVPGRTGICTTQRKLIPYSFWVNKKAWECRRCCVSARILLTHPIRLWMQRGNLVRKLGWDTEVCAVFVSRGVLVSGWLWSATGGTFGTCICTGLRC